MRPAFGAQDGPAG